MHSRRWPLPQFRDRIRTLKKPQKRALKNGVYRSRKKFLSGYFLCSFFPHVSFCLVIIIVAHELESLYLMAICGECGNCNYDNWSLCKNQKPQLIERPRGALPLSNDYVSSTDFKNNISEENLRRGI